MVSQRLIPTTPNKAALIGECARQRLVEHAPYACECGAYVLAEALYLHFPMSNSTTGSLSCMFAESEPVVSSALHLMLHSSASIVLLLFTRDTVLIPTYLPAATGRSSTLPATFDRGRYWALVIPSAVRKPLRSARKYTSL